MILGFLDELIRLDYIGREGRILAAREAGQKYLRDRLLPAWLANDTWGRYFWDWPNPVQNCLTTPDAARYVLEHPALYKNWRCDARNVLTVFLNRSSAAPDSKGDVYSGAWAYPEACQCCGRSLWYAPLCVAPTLAQYAVNARDPWARELAYRQLVLATYDAHDTGVTEDNIDGGLVVNGDWFNIAHPLPLRFLLTAIGWLPEELGANRENHICRSSAVVNSVTYGDGQVEYTTFDAPPETVDVLRLSFEPKRVFADGQRLRRRRVLDANGYNFKVLPNGDTIVSIRHDGARRLVVTGPDPQEMAGPDGLAFEGTWESEPDKSAARSTDQAGAAVSLRFKGNQVRVIGAAGPANGLADVFIDGALQFAPIDCWNPVGRSNQVLYYRNGLSNGWHTLRVAARGERNPYSAGTRITVAGIQFSAAEGRHHFSTGGGPREPQRMIFGYPKREDYRDSGGNWWRPATEFVTRVGAGKDTVPLAWWTEPCAEPILETKDPELYRYGVHGQDFWANLTVGPGSYYARLKFAAARGLDTRTNCFDVWINGQRVVEHLDVAVAAGGSSRALDLAFNNLTPRNGIIEIRFTATETAADAKAQRGQAFVQALELGPEQGKRP